MSARSKVVSSAEITHNTQHSLLRPADSLEVSRIKIGRWRSTEWTDATAQARTQEDLPGKGKWDTDTAYDDDCGN